jgi:hypothetical protein
MSDALEQLKLKFHECWIRGTAWRLEVGELLYQIKQECSHGEWGAFLEEYDLARSTADDYVRRHMEINQITEPRQFEEPNPTPDPDPEAEEREQDLEVEKVKRDDRKPVPNQTELHVRVKNITCDQLAMYYAEKKEHPARVMGMWLETFAEIIEPRFIQEQAEDEEAGLTDTPQPGTIPGFVENAMPELPTISIQLPNAELGGDSCIA